MKYFKTAVVLVFGLQCGATLGQQAPNAEALEVSPEARDAAFTAADAAREAAKWSDVVIDRSAPDPFAKMSAASDVVIRATVVSQSVVYDTNDLPFTHTTLAVSEVVQGEYTADTVTVIQEGGPSKTKPGNVIMVSDAHYFTVGNEELLFLSLDPDSKYVDRKVVVTQRFGVIDGKIFDEHGRGLIYSEIEEPPGYRLGLSDNRNPHPRFSEFHIGAHEFSKQFSSEPKGTDTGGGVLVQEQRSASTDYRASMDTSTLRAVLNR